MHSSPPRGRPRGFDREAALTDAVRLFWRKGYEAVSVRDLSAALGIGLPSLYSAFGDKQRLFTESVAFYQREYGGFIEAALAEERTAADAIRRILSEAPARYTRRSLPPGCLVVHSAVSSDAPEIRAMLNRLRAQKIELICAKMADDMAAGRLPPTTDSVAIASFVMTVVEGLAERARDGSDQHELARIADIAAVACP
ncbi:AcrR family transcriptional regulator [Microbacterium resistens]|uniref:AcrR family transcriptional regulator n=1 Tax=Microbacterium resistens TaxID=156977 RepID=A0ABU1S8X7_9MICO|nr:TetR/AcrR family transcriptional regulator [Microbacterium resistens]MDR6866049.1 AcrR family transcriptional regulator [Microbacterium resistens]